MNDHPGTIDPMETVLEITPQEVRRRLDDEDPLVLLDCRTQDEWSICHLQGATLIPLQEMSLRIHELEMHRNASIIVYCHKGARSMIITRLLRHSGYTDVLSMSGGIDRWACEIDSGLPRY
jgi:rhodanese-related sulfurtransferase